MVNIAESRRAVQSARQQSEEAEKKTKEAKSKLPEYKSQKALRQTYAGLKGRETRRTISKVDVALGKRQQEISQYKKGVEEYSKKLEEYASSPTGAVEEAKQSGATPIRYEYRRPFKGGELTPVPVYATAIGEVADESYWQEYRSKVIGDAIELGKIEGEKIEDLGFTSAKKLQEALEKGTITEAQVSQGLSSGLLKPVDEMPEVKNLKTIVVDLPVQERAGVMSMAVEQTNATDPNLFTRAKNLFFRGNQGGTSEIYNPALGGYVQATEVGGTQFSQGTAIIRPITEAESTQMQENKKKYDFVASSILGVPSTYFTLSEKMVSPETERRMSEGNFFQRLGGYLDPRTQYKAFKEDYEYQQALKETNRLAIKASNYEKKYNEGKISTEEYNAIISSIQQDDSWKKLEDKRNFYMQLAESNLSPQARLLSAGGIKGSETGSLFISPVARAVVGGDIAVRGFQIFSDVDSTDKESALGLGQTVLGGALAYSGARGFFPKSTGVTITGSQGAIKTVKILTPLTVGSTGLAFGALQTKSTLSQTGDIYTSLGAGLGVFGAVVGSYALPKLYKALKQEDWNKFLKNKRGQVAITQQDYEYDYAQGKFVKKKKTIDMTRDQAIFAFKNLPRSKQIEILQRAYRGRIYLDNKNLIKDLSNTKSFLEKSGLSSVQIADRLASLNIKLKITELTKAFNKGEITKAEYLNQLRILQLEEQKILQTTQSLLSSEQAITTPIIKQQGTMLESQISNSIFTTEVSPQNVMTVNWIGENGLQNVRQTSFLTGNAIGNLLNVKGEQLSLISQKEKLQEQTMQKSLQLNNLKINLLTGLATSQVSRQGSATSQLGKLKQKQPQDFLTATPQTYSLKKTTSKLIDGKLKPVSRSDRTIRPKPEKKLILTGLGSTSKGRTFTKKQVDDAIFTVFGKRFGKDIGIGVAETQKGAEKILKGFLKSTLGRSGQIFKDGKPLEFKDLKSFGNEFRPSKKSEKRIVQKAKFSLGTGGEVKEIQYFKKTSKSSKRKKSKNLFGL